jgi:hypothetical protein
MSSPFRTLVNVAAALTILLTVTSLYGAIALKWHHWEWCTSSDPRAPGLCVKLSIGDGRGLRVSYTWGDDGDGPVLVLAEWAPVVVIPAIFPIWLAYGRPDRYPFGKGRCPACGYDLRATPTRCPECGATPVVFGTTRP